jgi:hypothetical protein
MKSDDPRIIHVAGLAPTVIFVVGIHKYNRLFSELLRVFHTQLRPLNDVLGNDFPHGAGIAGTSEPAAGFLKSMPSVFESGCASSWTVSGSNAVSASTSFTMSITNGSHRYQRDREKTLPPRSSFSYSAKLLSRPTIGTKQIKKPTATAANHTSASGARSAASSSQFILSPDALRMTALSSETPIAIVINSFDA